MLLLRGLLRAKALPIWHISTVDFTFCNVIWCLGFKRRQSESDRGVPNCLISFVKVDAAGTSLRMSSGEGVQVSAQHEIDTSGHSTEKLKRLETLRPPLEQPLIYSRDTHPKSE